MTESTGAVSNGYNYKLFDDDPPNKCICHICKLVARDPQQVTCCSNIYCKTCLQQLKDKGSEFNCPTCRKPLTGNYFKDGRAEREIKSLRVYCSNTDSGCQWVGTINDIETHLNSCPYQLMRCTNGCGEDVRRSELGEHLTVNCPKRLVKCEYCQDKVPYQLETGSSHLDECPVKCSNEECAKKIPQCLLASHNETCPKAIITCEYNTVGCNKRMKREEKEDHNKESVQEHLQMTKETIESLKLTQRISLKLTGYTQKKRKYNKWQSPTFYTSPGGYNMTLRVYPNGDDDGDSTHVSCYIYLMPGEYDDALGWPFQGEVTIELLNQLEDKNHKKYTSYYNGSTPEECKQRVPKGKNNAEGWGVPRFIPHSELEYNPNTNCQYLKDDSLYFRVSVKVTSKTKPWLNVTI